MTMHEVDQAVAMAKSVAALRASVEKLRERIAPYALMFTKGGYTHGEPMMLAFMKDHPEIVAEILIMVIPVVANDEGLEMEVVKRPVA